MFYCFNNCGSVWAGGGITTHFHVTLLGIYGGKEFQPWPTLEEEEEWSATPRRFLPIAVTKVFPENAFQHVVLVLINNCGVSMGRRRNHHFHVTLFAKG